MIAYEKTWWKLVIILNEVTTRKIFPSFPKRFCRESTRPPNL